LNKIWITIKNLLDPLPKPEIALQKYWNLRFQHISGYEIARVVADVIEEARISRQFGLFLRPEDLDKEILFWLTFINHFEGPSDIQKKYSYEDMWEICAQASSPHFEKENGYYFDLISNSKPKITSSNNAFQCHLESVRQRILSEVFNNQLTIIQN
jgi:hypothetical protein